MTDIQGGQVDYFMLNADGNFLSQVSAAESIQSSNCTIFEKG
jgi:hypothetical protein